MFSDPIFSKRPTRVEISLSNLQDNISTIKNIIGNTKILGVIKANAYGHGLVEIALKLQSLNIDYLGVACIEEAVYLRKNKISTPILVLGAIDNSQIDLYIKNDIDIPGSSIEKLEQISKIATEMNTKAKVHLKIDTGMGRLGVQWDRCKPFIDSAYSLPNLDIVGIYSHFVDSQDDLQYTKEQIKRFRTVLKYLENKYTKPKLVHLGNSGAICNNIHESFFDMVRPGLVMYGYSYNPNIQKILKPVMTFKTEVSYFKVLEKGKSIGYDRTYTTKNITRILTLPVGYADGYPRSLSNVGYVCHNSKRYKIAGRVCMDQMMVDMGMENEAYVGDEIELWGENIFLSEISELSQRSIYEILCSISERVPRIYID